MSSFDSVPCFLFPTLKKCTQLQVEVSKEISENFWKGYLFLKTLSMSKPLQYGK